ncbi:MAG: zinc ribbon domain-containing protein [Anaerolineae bacterium]|nr:zinc ribbon domain-containing protein [Anaerolineae bacterium]
MRLRLSLLLVLLMLAFALPAAAQTTITFERLQIDIWPEFDRPEVLVILRATLSDSASLPARLTLRIPAAAGKPFTLAMQDMDGMLYNLPFETEESDDWALVTFTTPSANIQLEYYDPSLQVTGDQRSYNFLWQTNYAAETVVLQVQQPWGAEDMQITPDLGSGRKGADEYTYFTAPLGEVDANSAIRLRIDYSRSDTIGGATGIPVQPVSPLDEPIRGRMDVKGFWPWGVVVMGGLLLAGSIFWYVQSQRKSHKINRKHHAPPGTQGHESKPTAERPPGSTRRGTTPMEQPHVYCHSCGKRAQRGDVFCRTCGTKLRFE